jgi:hypothetical protein
MLASFPPRPNPPPLGAPLSAPKLDRDDAGILADDQEPRHRAPLAGNSTAFHCPPVAPAPNPTAETPYASPAIRKPPPDLVGSERPVMPRPALVGSGLLVRAANAGLIHRPQHLYRRAVGCRSQGGNCCRGEGSEVQGEGQRIFANGRGGDVVDVGILVGQVCRYAVDRGSARFDRGTSFTLCHESSICSTLHAPHGDAAEGCRLAGRACLADDSVFVKSAAAVRRVHLTMARHLS